MRRRRPVCAATAAFVLLGLAPARVAAAGPAFTSPCDAAPSAPFCDAALGPLRDVSATWREYQPALVQPVPVDDYRSDPEDAPAPLGVGVCGGETVHQAPSGPQVPPATVERAPIAGIPAPPGGWRVGAEYCVLRYIPADFTALCAGCVRLLVDFGAVPDVTPAANPLSPAASGHYALRMTLSDGNARALVDGHSPNAKNLCADKLFNPSPGAACDDPFVDGFDSMGLGIEGDTLRYIHYPLEGRYFNGPAYLAGDGAGVPYHWVRGMYMDVSPATSASAWYSAGYRGLGDPLPDVDQSYACPCEAAHVTFSGGVTLGSA